MRKFHFFRGFTNEWVSTQVVGGVRPLRAIWSEDLITELNAYHGINVENELISMMSNEISREIDNQILNTLMTNVMGRA